ncbi:hypothetical protein PR048_006656 [Dryococelus australis]|uniref:Uncharacterized protein n=1 Tax=Dryococelus australis TaxID=614101 RepID=A0ABQ9IBM7_9NEOP|nr:hypothetical protein PR048_006656 [Dryococelus australis]
MKSVHPCCGGSVVLGRTNGLRGSGTWHTSTDCTVYNTYTAVHDTTLYSVWMLPVGSWAQGRANASDIVHPLERPAPLAPFQRALEGYSHQAKVMTKRQNAICGGGGRTVSRLAMSSKTWRSNKILDSYSGTPGFESRYGHPDFCFHGFPKSLQANAGMEHCTLARAEDEHLYAKPRLGKVKKATGIARGVWKVPECARLNSFPVVATKQRSSAPGALRASLHYISALGSVQMLPEAASTPLKAAIEKIPTSLYFWQNLKEATGKRKHNENDFSSTGDDIIKEHRKENASAFFFECCMRGLKDKICSETLKTENLRESMTLGPKFLPAQETLPPVWKCHVWLRRFTKLSQEFVGFYKGSFLAKKKKAQPAREEEAALAIQAGDVDDDGIPVIAGVTDRAWRRSYGINYNILSGVYNFGSLDYRHVSLVLKPRRFYFEVQETLTVAFVIGHNLKATQQIPMCVTCTGTNPEIIVEGFRNSIDIHNLKYNKLIGSCIGPFFRLSTNEMLGTPLKVSYSYTQHDEKTARQFYVLFEEASGHLKHVPLSLLSLHCFRASNAQNICRSKYSVVHIQRTNRKDFQSRGLLGKTSNPEDLRKDFQREESELSGREGQLCASFTFLHSQSAIQPNPINQMAIFLQVGGRLKALFTMSSRQSAARSRQSEMSCSTTIPILTTSHDQHTQTNRIATCIALHEKNRTCSIFSFRARRALHKNLCKKFSCKVGISHKIGTHLASCDPYFRDWIPLILPSMFIYDNLQHIEMPCPYVSCCYLLSTHRLMWWLALYSGFRRTRWTLMPYATQALCRVVVRALRRVVEIGLWDHENRRSRPQRPTCSSKGAEVLSVDLVSLTPAFGLVVVGCTVSMLVLIAEIIESQPPWNRDWGINSAVNLHLTQHFTKQQSSTLILLSKHLPLDSKNLNLQKNLWSRWRNQIKQV